MLYCIFNQFILQKFNLLEIVIRIMDIKVKHQKNKIQTRILDKSNELKKKSPVELPGRKGFNEKRNSGKDLCRKNGVRVIKQSSNSFSGLDVKKLSFQKEKKQNNSKEKGKQKKNIAKDIEKHHSLTRIKSRPHKQMTLPGFDEYFLFQNKIIPIINSDEKRVVNNYLFTPNSTGEKWKNFDCATQTYFPKRIETKDCEIMTEIIQRKNQSWQIIAQTKTESTITDTIKPVELKFDQFLTKLEFLYLPDSQNFEQLSQLQKQHYKQLFKGIVQKLEGNRNNLQKPVQNLECNQAIEQFQANQRMAFRIQQRIGQQMNCIQVEIQNGISTNLLNILSYLSNLFCFLEVQYKQLLIKGLNSPYGAYMQNHFKNLTKSDQIIPKYNVLPDIIYYQFEKEFFSDDGQQEVIIQAVHMHNKVIFDCLNEQLNIFRPYYACGGQPFPWYSPGKITFFSIGEDDIQLVFEKSKVKILQNASLLCGILCDDSSNKNSQNDNPQGISVLRDIRQQRQRKLIYSSIRQIDQSSPLEDQRTLFVLQLCDLIFQKIMNEQTRTLISVKNRK